MALPEHIQQLVDESLIMMRKNPEHHLLPVQRLEIYQLLEPLPSNDASIRYVGGQLAIASARYVLPIWQQARPIWGDEEPAIDWGGYPPNYPLTDALPEWMIQRAEEVLRGDVGIELAEEDMGDLWDVYSNLREEITAWRTDVPEEAWYAFAAAYYALQETNLAPFTYNMPNDTMTDPDRESGAGRLDGAAAAMIACVGVDTNKPGIVTKRLEFWEWWLTEAIPAAWEMAQQSNTGDK
jgi:hypothetical protein